jgi:hypothetical protein
MTAGRGYSAAIADWQPLGESVTRELLKVEAQAAANRIGIEPKDVQARPMKRKWARCSPLGRLSMDDELLTQPARFRREVIVHDLLHLWLPNQGGLFLALMKAYLAEAE